MRRRLFLALGLTATSGVAPLVAPSARAAEQRQFTAAEFARAQAAGAPILVFVEASWCPTCARERPILARLAADPAFKDLKILDVDFDRQKDVVRSLGVRMQSTLIVFRGRNERGRATGETDPQAIRALVEKSNA